MSIESIPLDSDQEEALPGWGFWVIDAICEDVWDEEAYGTEAFDIWLGVCGDIPELWDCDMFDLIPYWGQSYARKGPAYEIDAFLQWCSHPFRVLRSACLNLIGYEYY
jgi:hypothetical protein